MGFNSGFKGLSIFRKFVEKIQVSLKSDKNNGYFTWRTLCMFWSYLGSVLLTRRMRNVSDKGVQKIKTHTLCSITFFFRKSCLLWEKCCTARQATDGSRAHAHCVLDTSFYKHTIRIRNTNCFSPATMVARKRLNVKVQVHWGAEVVLLWWMWVRSS